MKTRLLNLPFAEWPVEDQRLWLAAFDDTDPFGENLGGRLSPASKTQYLFGWRRFLGFLSIHQPKTLELSITERLKSPTVNEFIAHLDSTNTKRSTAIQIDALYKAARIMLPNVDLFWLKSIKGRLYALSPAPRAKGPALTSVQVFERARELMDSPYAKGEQILTAADFLQFRDGLILAFLAFMPIRVKNLAAIEIGRHLVRRDTGWNVRIPSTETKNKTEIEFDIHPCLDPYLEFYTNVVRDRLAKDSADRRLWIGEHGSSLRANSISAIVAKRMTGFADRITPHDLRDAAATMWAIHKPEQIVVARDLLSHKTLKTIDRHYNRARGIEACRAYSDIIRQFK